MRAPTQLRRGGFVAAAIALTAAAACTPGGGGDAAEAIRRQKEREATASIRAPGPPPEKEGRIGVLVSTNSIGWQRALGSDRARGAVVAQVFEGSAAARSGLRRGDVVTAVGGKPVLGEERARVLMRASPGETVELRIVRDGETIDVNVIARDDPPPNLRLVYERVIRRDPDDAATYVLRAQIQSADQDALEDADRALELVPELVEALSLRARLFWRESLSVPDATVASIDRAQAIEDFDRALEVDGRAMHVFLARGQSQLESREYEGARADALTAISIDPESGAAHSMLATALLLLGEPEAALRAAARAVALNPYASSHYRALAQAFAAVERAGDAQRTVESGLAVATTDQERASLRAVLSAGDSV